MPVNPTRAETVGDAMDPNPPPNTSRAVPFVSTKVMALTTCDASSRTEGASNERIDETVDEASPRVTITFREADGCDEAIRHVRDVTDDQSETSQLEPTTLTAKQ